MTEKTRYGYQVPINEETSEEDLHRCIIEAGHRDDRNMVRAAADAQAELTRRDKAEWERRFNAESRERVNAQKFQQGQADKMLDVAGKQATSARHAMIAAWAAAVATVAIAVISAVSLLNK